MDTFHTRLKALHKKTGKTQKTVAKHLGISEQQYSSYVQGRSPKYDVLCGIADYFGVTTDYLLGRTKDSIPSADDAAICGRLGISRDALQTLERISNRKDNCRYIVDWLLSDSYLEKYASYVTEYINCMLRRADKTRLHQTEKLPNNNQAISTIPALYEGTDNELSFYRYMCDQYLWKITNNAIVLMYGEAVNNDTLSREDFTPSENSDDSDTAITANDVVDTKPDCEDSYIDEDYDASDAYMADDDDDDVHPGSTDEWLYVNEDIDVSDIRMDASNENVIEYKDMLDDF